MQEKEDRRSIMLTGDVHASLSALCGQMGATHNLMVEAAIQIASDGDNIDRLRATIKEHKDKVEEAKKQRRELAAKLAAMSDDDIAKLMEQID